MIKLKELTDNELVNKCLKESCSECIEELEKRHIGIIIKVQSRYAKRLLSLGYSQDELNNDTKNIIWQSIQKFNPQKSQFNTFLWNSARYYFLNLITSLTEHNHNKLDLEQESFNNLHDDSHIEKENLELNKYIFNILNQLPDKRIPKIYKLRYFSKKKMSFKQIGLKMKLSGWWISLLLQKSNKLLKEKMLEKNICDKI